MRDHNTNVTSSHQSGGLTAGTVNVRTPTAAKASGWQKTSTIVALIGVALAVLTYLGIKFLP